VIGDSHSQGLASELQSHLGHEYSVSGTILLGACLKNITQLAKNELTNLTRKDTIVIWDGSNDVYKNEAQSGLKCVHTFINQRTNTNILTLTNPHRHDLSSHSCVNKEIQSYNRKLNKMTKNLNRVKVVEYDYGGTVGLCWNDNYSTTHICKYLFMSKVYSEVAAYLPLFLSSAVE
jgi:hypothetical protein